MSESKDLTAQQRFEEQLYDRLREDVAELLPDDVLSEMTKNAINKMLFEPKMVRVKERYGSGYTTKRANYSWFEEKVESLMRSRLDALSKQWMADNADFLCEQFANTMIAKMPELVARAIFKPVDNSLVDLEAKLKMQISEYMQQQFNAPMMLP